MTVVNLAPGAIMNVAANQIRRECHVYRTRDGYDGAGSVGWAPANGAVQSQDVAIGQTVTFWINGQAGMIANGAPSRVQVLYDNGAALTASTSDLRQVSQILKRGRATESAPKRAMRGSAAPMASSTAQDAMNTLNAQWYNAVITGCHLDPSTFQLMQGNSPLGATSEILWNMLDVVPPLSISNFFNPSQMNVFSTDYGAVIMNLKEQNANKFINDMGDYYSQWRA